MALCVSPAGVRARGREGSRRVAVGSANGFPAAWASADGGRTWHRGTGATPAVLTRPGLEQLTSVTHGGAGWLAVGDVTGAAPARPVVIGSADGSLWSAADGEAAFAGSGLVTEQAAAGPGGYVIVGSQLLTQTTGHRMISSRTVAAVWWSAGLTGWQRSADASAGALAGPGDRRMLAAPGPRTASSRWARTAADRPSGCRPTAAAPGPSRPCRRPRGPRRSAPWRRAAAASS